MLTTDNYHTNSIYFITENRFFFSDHVHYYCKYPLILLPDLLANTVSSFAKCRKALHHPPHRAKIFLLWTKSIYLCVIVNIHYIDRSVAVTYKKKSVFFRLQDLQKVNIGTTINKNKIFELQTKENKQQKMLFTSISSKHGSLSPLQNLQSTHHCQNLYLLSDIWYSM